MCFFALPDTPSYSDSLAFQCQGALSVAQQSRVSGTEFFLSAACFIPVIAAAKAEKGTSSRFQADLLHVTLV